MSESDTKKKGLKSPFLKFLWDVLIIVLIAVVVSFVVKTFLIRSFFIPSGSMENTLRIDDRVIVNELVPNVIGLQRGDIIVFKDPGNWADTPAVPALNPVQAVGTWVSTLFGLVGTDNNDHLIKRVIGLPGDTIECCSPTGLLLINGEPIKEPYIYNGSGESKASYDFGPVTVPAGTVFVLGDHRDNSADSRVHLKEPGGGFVPISDVVGKAFVLTWPFNHFTWLGNYPEVYQQVPDPASPATPLPSGSPAATP